MSFCLIVTVQNQTRYVRDLIRKENTTVSLMEQMIIMFDHEGDKTTEEEKKIQPFFTSQLKKFGDQINEG